MSLNVNKRAKPKLKLSELDLKKYLTLKIHLSDLKDWNPKKGS